MLLSFFFSQHGITRKHSHYETHVELPSFQKTEYKRVMPSYLLQDIHESTEKLRGQNIKLRRYDNFETKALSNKMEHAI